VCRLHPAGQEALLFLDIAAGSILTANIESSPVSDASRRKYVLSIGKIN